MAQNIKIKIVTLL